MTYSMTGFGRCELTSEKRKICMEIKSVNHRFLDINIRIPKQLNAFEVPIRNEIKKYLKRGKIDLFVTYEDKTEGQVHVNYDATLAEEYVSLYKEIASQFSLQDTLTPIQIMNFPNVITEEEAEPDEAQLEKLIMDALDQACQTLLESRAKEGKNLKVNLLEKLDQMQIDTAEIAKRGPQLIEEYRVTLQKKLKELLEDTSMEESRLAAETVLYADKICVDEELVRLKSHIETMKEVLSSDGHDDIGRRLDFLAQEMNREANTILSKVNDAEVSQFGISLKTCIEKVREQVQNIE